MRYKLTEEDKEWVRGGGTFIVPDDMIDSRMTLVMALKLQSGFLVLADGKVTRNLAYGYGKQPVTELKTQLGKHKVYSLAPNLVIGISGRFAEDGMRIFRAHTKEYLKNKPVTDLFQHEKYFKKYLRLIFKVNRKHDYVSVLLISDTQILRLDDGVPYPLNGSVYSVGAFTESLNSFKKKYKDKIFKQDQGMKEAIQVLRQVKDEDSEVGGSVRAYIIQDGSVKPLGIVAKL